tara:strand:- start:285 stop:476 length:192 start_codon:yes stop_codon:yes gene_type:complete
MSDRKTPEQVFEFDKFVDSFQEKDIEKRERQKTYVDEHADSPNRQYNKLYRERWQNRIKWRRN